MQHAWLSARRIDPMTYRKATRWDAGESHKVAILGNCLVDLSISCRSLVFLCLQKGNRAMSVLDTERRSATRSALHYRPSIDTDQADASPVVSRAHRRADARVTSAPLAPDDLDVEEEQAPGRRAIAPKRRQPAPPTHTRQPVRPWFFIGLGLVAIILLWIGISQAVTQITNEYNNVVYGNPRTYQVDAVVGQGDDAQHPSHFLAVNLRGIVTIIDFPAGDPGRARVLATTSVLGPNADQAVVTLRFIDVNHNNGRPDMLIDIDGVESVLINDQGTFRPPTPAEQQQILNALRQNNN